MQEEDELVKEWTPEPLVPSVEAKHRSEPRIITGYVLSFYQLLHHVIIFSAVIYCDIYPNMMILVANLVSVQHIATM